ncbi:MAG TPA: NUDIX domain-containing protein [Solirubrobacteraceae bacterium]|jgi:8-oxo-dGTP pyrophosphatase MutT (NUDIX family)
MRVGYRVAYRALTLYGRVVAPTANGVKCLLRDDRGRVLFVRHNYGARSHWELPGGGVRRGERGDEAAEREAWEELGVQAAAWRESGSTEGRWYGQEHVLTIFTGEDWHGPLRTDPVEIAVAEWFPLDRPPAPLGPTTVAALDALVRSDDA